MCASVAIGPHEDLLAIVKRRNLQRYDHVSRSSGLAKTILQGTVKGGKRQSQVPEGSGEQGEMEETGCEIVFGGHQRPSRLRDR